jgi:tetratricopeptide (TPR) repeat protein
MRNFEKKQIKKKRKHRLLFIFTTVFVFPIVGILLIEFGLRIFGFGYNTNVVKKCTINEGKSFCNNDDFSRRFFNKNLAREFFPFTFSQTKPKNTYRIFIFGSSAAKGEPDSSYSFGRILEIMLESRYPSTDFEIINTALTAINSNVILKAVEECTKYQPDAFVVYMGNNEVVGPYGAGTVFSPISSNIYIIRASIFIKGTKIGQMMSAVFEKLLSEKNARWGGMEMFMGRLVGFKDKKLQTVYKHFEKNLDDICRIADSKKIPLILSTVPTNIKDCPPFASLHKSDLTKQQIENWDNLYQQGVEKENLSLYQDAVEYYLKSESIDSSFADLQFRLGHCMYALGQYEKAGDRFILAREYDALRFRADDTINRIIKSVANDNKDHQIYLADALKVFEEESPQKIIGGLFFYEHVHLNFKGNFLLARIVSEQTEKLLPEQIRKNKIDDTITEEKCQNLLAFTGWDKYRTEKIILDEYLSRTPFTNQLYHDNRINKLKQKIKSLENFLTENNLKNCVNIYQKAIENRPDDWVLRFNFACLLSDALNDYKGAAEQMSFVVQKVPQNYQAVAKLGIFYSRCGEYEKATQYLKQASSIKANDGIYFNLAVVFQKQGKFEDAVSCYKQTVALNPGHGKAWCNMTALLGEMNRLDEAIELCRKGLKNLPDDEALNLGLATLLILDGCKDEAIKQLKDILKTDPNLAEGRIMLEKLING